MYRFGFALVSVALMGAANAQTITSMGTLPTYTTYYPVGLSTNGNIAAGWAYNGVSERAFRWTSSGGIVDLGTVSPAYLAPATGMSRDGQVVVATMQGFGPFGNSNHGFRWTPSSPWTDIGLFYVGADWTDANNISGDGLKILGRTRIQSGAMRAYTWTTSGGFSLLPIGPTSFNSVSAASNYDASYIVGNMDVAGVSHAVRWGPSGVVNLGTPIIAGGSNYCTAVDVSDNGSTVLIYSLMPSGARPIYIWQDTGGPGTYTLVPPLPGYGIISAGSIATDGTAFVGGCSSGPPDIAILRSNDLGTLNLNTWLPTVGVNLTGWNLQSATRLSADGTAIAGAGKLNGVNVPFVVRGIPCLHKPTIYQDPEEQAVCIGTTTGFSASATGSFIGALTYQWYRDGSPIFDGPSGFGSNYAGTQSSFMTISSVALGDAANYYCIISNPCGNVSSAGAQLSIIPNPFVSFLPASQTACNGSSTSFTVGATNATTFGWQVYSPFTASWNYLSNGLYTDAFGLSFVVSNVNSPTIGISNIQFGSNTSIELRFECGNACRSLRPTASFFITPDSPPTVQLLSADKVDCYPSYNNFTAIGNSPFPMTYQWQKYDPVFATWFNLPLFGNFTEFFTGFSATYSLTQNPTFSYSIDNIGIHPPVAYFRCLIANGCGTTVTNVISHSWRNCPYTCPADFDGSGGTPDNSDVNDFWAAWLNGDECADVDCSGGTPDAADVQLFYDLWLAGGCDVPCPLCP